MGERGSLMVGLTRDELCEECKLLKEAKKDLPDNCSSCKWRRKTMNYANSLEGGDVDTAMEDLLSGLTVETEDLGWPIFNNIYHERFPKERNGPGSDVAWIQAPTKDKRFPVSAYYRNMGNFKFETAPKTLILRRISDD